MVQFNFGGRSLAAALALLAVAVVTAGADVSVFAPAKAAAPATAWQKTVDGVIVTPASGAARRVRLQVMSDGIIRVTAAPAGNLETPKSLMVVAAPAPTQFDAVASGDTLSLKTAKLTAEVSLATGL